MRGRFSVEEFESRVYRLIKSMVDVSPSKPVFVITIYPNGDIYQLNQDNPVTIHNSSFDGILRKVVKEISAANLFLIEGDKVLTDFSGLSSDLLHPSDYGHIIMGENLSRIIKAYRSE